MNFKKPTVTPMGLITVISAVTLVMLGAMLAIISLQNIDLKNLFNAYNQSVVENREKAVQDADFRALQLRNILTHIDDQTKVLNDRTDVLENKVDYIVDLLNASR